ncbi:MAG: VWA domain-containing protein [Pseudomonadota bacterium]
MRKSGLPQQPGTTKPTTPSTSGAGAVAAFLNKANQFKPGEGKGRLIFALDATMSRQPTWDAACSMQAEMFKAVGQAANLAVQLVYFRGFGECRSSKWVMDTKALARLMSGIDCRGGQTQIGKVLLHAQKEARAATAGNKVSALVFVGDAMEEDVDMLCHRAGELGLLGVPAFMFQEGHDGLTEKTFRELARLSKGAYVRFDQGAAAQLAELLKAVARFASGGRAALESNRSRGDRLLLEQLKK